MTEIYKLHATVIVAKDYSRLLIISDDLFFFMVNR